MANVALPGFRPIKSGFGRIPYARVQAISNNTLAIFKGDCVTKDANGFWYVSSAGGGAQVGSVALGCSYVDASGKIVEAPYLPAATTYTVSNGSPRCSWLYIVDPNFIENIVFEASVLGAIAQTDLGLNYDFVAGAGSTATGLSGHYLTSTGRATTNTIQWRVDAFIDNGRNDRTLTNAAVECTINVGVAPASTLTGI